MLFFISCLLLGLLVCPRMTDCTPRRGYYLGSIDLYPHLLKGELVQPAYSLCHDNTDAIIDYKAHNRCIYYHRCMYTNVNVYQSTPKIQSENLERITMHYAHALTGILLHTPIAILQYYLVFAEYPFYLSYPPEYTIDQINNTEVNMHRHLVKASIQAALGYITISTLHPSSSLHPRVVSSFHRILTQDYNGTGANHGERP